MIFKHLSTVSQKNIFVPSTILQNVLLGTDATKEEARRLLNRMGLGYLNLERDKEYERSFRWRREMFDACAGFPEGCFFLLYR